MNVGMFICGMVWIFTGLLHLIDRDRTNGFFFDLLMICWILIGICFIYFSK